MNCFENAIIAANEILNFGQGSKSQIKEVNSALNRAYDEVEDKYRDVVREYCAINSGVRENHTEENSKAYWAMLDEYDVPFDLHQVRAKKHQEKFEKFGFWGQIEALVELRAAIKENVEVIARKPKEVSEEVLIKAEVLKSFEELSEEKQREFDWACNVMEAFSRRRKGKKVLPISVNAVYCQNEFGTRWIRIDWYLAGCKTAFNMIMAAAQKVGE